MIISPVTALPLRREDPFDAPFTNPAKLYAAGVRFCVANDGADGEMGIKTFKVRITNDTLNEATETVKLTLADATNGASTSLPFQTTLRILDNDPALPAVRISNAVVTEGNGGFVNATFTVTLSGYTYETVTVNYATANGTASAGTDYTAVSGQLTKLLRKFST